MSYFIEKKNRENKNRKTRENKENCFQPLPMRAVLVGLAFHLRTVAWTVHCSFSRWHLRLSPNQSVTQLQLQSQSSTCVASYLSHFASPSER